MRRKPGESVILGLKWRKWQGVEWLADKSSKDWPLGLPLVTQRSPVSNTGLKKNSVGKTWLKCAQESSGGHTLDYQGQTTMQGTFLDMWVRKRWIVMGRSGHQERILFV